MVHTATPGGNRLRALREARGKTQLEVELDASLGTGYLQRVESGKVRHPERDTLERIVTALGAQYTERRDILELFGYLVDTPPPSEEEIGWAVGLCQAELHNAVFPAYLLDCAHQLLAWNAIFPRLYDVRKFPSEKRLSMLRLLFDPKYGFTDLVANPDTFFPATIRALRGETQLVHGEAWHEAVIAELSADCPKFEHYWTLSHSIPAYPVAARPLTTLEVNAPQAGLLKFRVTSEHIIQDRRFRMIYTIPADPATMEWSLGGS
jgi:transcriptional regulator with XRE-family HTH domain